MSKSRDYMSAKFIKGSILIFALGLAIFTAEPTRAQSRPSAADINVYLNSEVLTGRPRRSGKVDVIGSGFFTDFSDNVRINASVPELQLSDTQSGGRDWRLMSGSSGAGYFNIYDHNAGQYRLTIATSGNVGIGTTNPAARLDVRTADATRIQSVAGAANGYGLMTTTTDGSYSSYAEFGSYGSSYSATLFGQSVGNWSFLYTAGSSSNGLAMGTANAKPLLLGTANTERMRIDSSGNVGIGTTNPAANLQVESSSSPTIRLVSTGDNVAYQRIKGSTGDWYAGLFGSADYSIGDITNSNATYLTVKRTSGNVGIGTTNPAARLDVRTADATRIQSVAGAANGYGLVTTTTDGSYSSYAEFGSYGSSYSATLFGQSVGNWSFLYTAGSSSNGLAMGTANAKPLLLGTANTERIRIDSSGNVGIGTSTPGYKLDVNGNTNVQGNITATGSIAAKYQDVAEWVPSSEQLSAGTVVVLDSTKSNQVISSSVSYDTRVAGVISAQPGIALGEKGDSKVLVATTGRVKVKVDASKGPIHIGDLLVTSDTLGFAMKSAAVNLGGVQFHRPGTLIGKALEPLEKGKGEILVLLSLQ